MILTEVYEYMNMKAKCRLPKGRESDAESGVRTHAVSDYQKTHRISVKHQRAVRQLVLESGPLDHSGIPALKHA